MEETPPFRPEDIALVTGQTAPIDDPENATVTAGELTTQLTSKADTTYVNTQLGLKADTTAIPDISGKADTTYVNTQLGLKADVSGISTLVNNAIYGNPTRLEALGAATTANITTAWMNNFTEITHSAAVVLSLDAAMTSNTTGCVIQIFNNAVTTLRINITGLLSEGDRVYVRARGIVFLRYIPLTSVWLLTGALQSGA